MDNQGPEGLICVYAPTAGTERKDFFEYLTIFVMKWECQNFTIFGDFNAILYSDEKWGVNVFGSVLEELISFVNSPILQDISLVGSKYTFFEGGLVGGDEARNDL